MEKKFSGVRLWLDQMWCCLHVRVDEVILVDADLDVHLHSCFKYRNIPLDGCLKDKVQISTDFKELPHSIQKASAKLYVYTHFHLLVCTYWFVSVFNLLSLLSLFWAVSLFLFSRKLFLELCASLRVT